MCVPNVSPTIEKDTIRNEMAMKTRVSKKEFKMPGMEPKPLISEGKHLLVVSSSSASTENGTTQLALNTLNRRKPKNMVTNLLWYTAITRKKNKAQVNGIPMM
jgi:hypothetical protein